MTEPRTWYSGDPEPPDDVDAVTDRDGYAWERNSMRRWDGQSQWYNDTAEDVPNKPWADLVDEFGPLAERRQEGA